MPTASFSSDVDCGENAAVERIGVRMRVRVARVRPGLDQHVEGKLSLSTIYCVLFTLITTASVINVEQDWEGGDEP